MLGLGSNMMKHPVTGKSIVRDGLVLQHNYNLSSVEPLSSGAAFFDEGNADYITMGDVAAFTDADGFSISFWVNFVTYDGDTALVTKHANLSDLNNQGEFYIYNDDGICRFIAVDDDNSASIGTRTGSVFTDGQWHHVACTHDGGTAATGLLIYVDGVLQAHNTTSTGSGFANIVATTEEFRLGAFADSGEPHDGYMCNVGYWNAALSQAQVKSIMNKNYDGLSASEKTNLVSWWNLDSVIPDSTTLVYDNHHGGVEILGSEEVTYPNFTNSDISQWKIASSRATPSWDAAEFLRLTYDVATGAALYATFGQTLNVVYKVTMRVRGTKADGTTAQGSTFNSIGDNGVVGNAVSNPTLTSEWQDYEFYATSTSSTFRLYLASAVVGDLVDFDSISVKEINGNTGTLS
tara:strand:+ start:367 stop:1584 length:1218 start_codon:yes stop_codon:yes gene_type:complete